MDIASHQINTPWKSPPSNSSLLLFVTIHPATGPLPIHPTETAPAAQRVRHWIWTIVRFAVLAAIIAYVVSVLSWYDQVHLRDGTSGRLVSVSDTAGRVTLRTERGDLTVPRREVSSIEKGLVSLVKSVTWPEAAAAMLLTLLVPYISAYRLYLVMNNLGIPAERTRVMDVALVSNVYLLVTPGSAGGDAYRTVTLSRDGASWRRVLLAVVIDRLLGVFALAVWTGLAACALINDPVFANIATWICVAFIAGVIGLALVLYLRLYRYVFKWLRVALKKFTTTLENLEDVIDEIIQDRKLLAKPIALSLIAQAMTLSAAALLGLSLGIDHAFEAAWLLIPSALILVVVSPTPQGLGVLEGVLVVFLAPLITGGANASVLLALGVRMLSMLWSVPGAILMLRGKG